MDGAAPSRTALCQNWRAVLVARYSISFPEVVTRVAPHSGNSGPTDSNSVFVLARRHTLADESYATNIENS